MYRADDECSTDGYLNPSQPSATLAATARERRAMRRRHHRVGVRVGPLWRRWVVKHRRLYWPVVVILLAISVGGVHRRTAELERQQARWSATTTVWAATTQLRPGDPITGKVTAVEVPLALAPDHRWATPDGVARQHIDPGTILMKADVATGDGTDALVPDGWVAIAVSEPVASGGAIGDRVGVISSGLRIVEEAIIISNDDEVVLIAVPADEAGLVATANENRSVSLVHLPG